MSDPPPVLDTNILRSFAFAASRGIEILLQGLNTTSARFPREVYAIDEDTQPLTFPDDTFSEFGRGLRMAKRKAQNLPTVQAERFAIWLSNAQQLPRHLERGSLVLDPLIVEELLLRDQLERSHKLGRGEAACIVLAEREHAPALFVSEDDEACKVARIRGVNVVMRQSVLEHWVKQTKPSRTDLDMLLQGLEKARFTVHPQEIKALYKLL